MARIPIIIHFAVDFLSTSNPGIDGDGIDPGSAKGSCLIIGFAGAIFSNFVPHLSQNFEASVIWFPQL